MLGRLDGEGLPDAGQRLPPEELAGAAPPEVQGMVRYKT